jgi:uncharacterized protein YjbI with pentapeptide repeats
MTTQKQPKPAPRTKSKRTTVWTLERVISSIEKNGGSRRLDLSGQDLRQVDWSAEAVAYQLEKRDYRPGDELPKWVSPFAARGARGLNMKEAILKNANLQYANLQGIDFTRANFEGADLRDTCLRESNFFEANLSFARLWRADLRRTTLNNAVLKQTSFYRAEFEDTEFLDADLTNTVLHRNDLSKIIVRRKSLPNRLIIENFKQHAALVKWDDPAITPKEWEREVVRYLERAKDAYRGLKICFSNNGMYQDASWAYFRERVVERRMHGLSQIMLYFGDSIKGMNLYPLRYLWLHIKHSLIWLAFWLEELTCGYGERPLRTLGFAAAVIFGFAPLYWNSGGISAKLDQSLRWSDYLIYSMSTFATVNLPRFNVINTIAELLTSLEALFGIAILALLMFALGNRISRS